MIVFIPAVVAILCAAAPAFAQNAERGEREFRLCASCQDTGVCVENGTDHSYFFSAEAGDIRTTAPLDPGQVLCAEGEGSGGVVSVFETADVIEGCSRLVDRGTTETLMRYADFDRCSWSSHKKAEAS